MQSHTRLILAFSLLLALGVTGTVGYVLIEGAGWWDATYMTVITLTTVGYREVFPLSRSGEVFTALLLVVGLGLFLFLVTDIARTIIEGELQQVLGRARRSRMIERMQGHEIVCGYGRMGRAVVAELRRAGRQVVVVDRNLERTAGLQDQGVPFVAGDATSVETLQRANITSASGLVACLNDDAHNVYTVLTARSLNAKIFIVARAAEAEAERRILQAGADRAVNPYQIGGNRLAHMVVKPTIVSFFDASLRGDTELQLDQAVLREGGPITGKTLSEADVRRRWGLGVVAVQREGAVLQNPPSDFRLTAGDILIVFGTLAQVRAFDQACGDSEPAPRS
ncbi:MAG: TrkA family potassium uptake protein [Vicinamibacterales bacterium]